MGKFFVEPKKGFLLVQWRDKGTFPRACFVLIKNKALVIYDGDDYPPKVCHPAVSFALTSRSEEGDT